MNTIEPSLAADLVLHIRIRHMSGERVCIGHRLGPRVRAWATYLKQPTVRFTTPLPGLHPYPNDAI
jgi:hypothetical protein